MLAFLCIWILITLYYPYTFLLNEYTEKKLCFVLRFCDLERPRSFSTRTCQMLTDLFYSRTQKHISWILFPGSMGHDQYFSNCLYSRAHDNHFSNCLYSRAHDNHFSNSLYSRAHVQRLFYDCIIGPVKYIFNICFRFFAIRGPYFHKQFIANAVAKFSYAESQQTLPQPCNLQLVFWHKEQLCLSTCALKKGFVNLSLKIVLNLAAKCCLKIVKEKLPWKLNFFDMWMC